MQKPSANSRSNLTRLAIDRLRKVYAVLVLVQVVTISLYELGRLTSDVAATAGLATSLPAPC